MATIFFLFLLLHSYEPLLYIYHCSPLPGAKPPSTELVQQPQMCLPVSSPWHSGILLQISPFFLKFSSQMSSTFPSLVNLLQSYVHCLSISMPSSSLSLSLRPNVARMGTRWPQHLLLVIEPKLTY